MRHLRISGIKVALPLELAIILMLVAAIACGGAAATPVVVEQDAVAQKEVVPEN